MKVTIDQIPDYLEQRVSAEEAAQIKNLIETDPEWKSVYERLKATMRKLEKNKNALKEFPENYWNHFSARLQGRIYRSQKRRIENRRRFQLISPIAAAAAVLIVFGLMIARTNEKINYVYDNFGWWPSETALSEAEYSSDADLIWNNYFGTISEANLDETDLVSGTTSPIERTVTENELKKLSEDETIELLKELNENVTI